VWKENPELLGVWGWGWEMRISNSGPFLLVLFLRLVVHILVDDSPHLPHILLGRLHQLQLQSNAKPPNCCLRPLSRRSLKVLCKHLSRLELYHQVCGGNFTTGEPPFFRPPASFVRSNSAGGVFLPRLNRANTILPSFLAMTSYIALLTAF
jgi:hypothetical protein